MEFWNWIVDALTYSLDLILNLSDHLQDWTEALGPWTYVLIFVIIFLECGIVIAPFLPGDSLLFALGALAATGSLQVQALIPTLILAAILGGYLNYLIGKWMGPKVFQRKDAFFFKKSHLTKTHDFYEKHGGKTVLLARFIPIIRTFAPFVAGVAKMDFNRFNLFNIVGAIGWVISMTLLGHFFGNFPFVKENFGVVVPAIIVISALPILWEYIAHKKRNRKKRTSP